jgi:hypothetical protein
MELGIKPCGSRATRTRENTQFCASLKTWMNTNFVDLGKNGCFNGGIVLENELICIGYKEGPICPVFLLIHCRVILGNLMVSPLVNPSAYLPRVTQYF